MDGFLNLSPAQQQALLDGPALKPPPGVVPNFIDPPNRTTTGYIITGGSFVAVAWSVLTYGHHAGFYVRQWNIPVRKMIGVSHVSYQFTILYTVVMIFSKTAILLEWARIFVPHGVRNSFYWTSRFLIVLNFLFYSSALITTCLSCIPAEKVWNKWVPGRCIERKPFDTAVVAFNLALDLLIFALPQKVIWSLKLDKSRKVGVSIVFSVGALRLDYHGDVAYSLSQTLMFTVSECTCVLLVFFVPAIPRIFSNNSAPSKLFSSFRSWTRRLSSKGSNSSVGSGGQVAFPPMIGGKPENHAYGKMDEEARAISLDEIKVVQPPRAKLGITNGIAKASNNCHQPSGNLIIMTTELEQHDDSASKTSAGSDLDHHHHPWGEPRV
ncbi:hypothetical protein PT974_12373 [Cladobotryum mycophilum]|uniref:Rhodopsin domain-containing protein n=1 Tax=Cladobotryum mycophilum TaxID=491253 RepID=A0ABR0S7T7_9HYPO